MTPATLLIAFFLFTLAAVSAAGYAFVLKPSRTESRGGDAPLTLALNHPDLPTAQAAPVLGSAHFRIAAGAGRGRISLAVGRVRAAGD